MEYSTRHIDYLARAFLDEYSGVLTEPLSAAQVAIPPQESIQLLRVAEVGRTWVPDNRRERENQRVRYRSEDVLCGCFGAKLPFMAGVFGQPGKVTYLLGTFAGIMNHGSRGGGDHSLAVLRALLEAQYPGSRFEPFPAKGLNDLLTGQAGGYLGLVTGLPTAKEVEEAERSTQIDRLIRAMSGSTWGMVGLAEPLSGSLSNSLHHAAINEMRNVENAEQIKARRGPLAEAYFRDLEQLVKEFEQGAATGMWTTSLFFSAPSRDVFDALRSIIVSCFSGEESKPDPVRTIEIASRGALRSGLGQVLLGTIPPPGEFEYPHSLQTLLSSTRLASYFHLPRQEAEGLTVRDTQRFDISPPPVGDGRNVHLGRVIDRGRLLKQDYLLTTSALNKHALIVGVTGSGKTNTCFGLLSQMWKEGIPFLVIEPTKREYRSLLYDPVVGEDLRVFTLGNERLSPLRMNPFEHARGVSLSGHIDLLKSVFNAAFSMWTVLPQILEQSLHEVYREYGWDIVQGENTRIGNAEEPPPDAYPTLADLEQCIIRVVDRLGYEPNTTSEIKAALVTRLRSLRIGGKGKMLDTRFSFPVEELLAKPTILELEEIGDDDEKAFIIGILLARLYEHLRGKGLKPDSPLQHVCVIEEAHRLLANVRRGVGHETADTRGKAVETFVNMLSEVRAYGEGFVVAEQIPEKLAPDVLKNTNIKLVHRTVAGDDRRLLSEAMNMQERQSKMLSTLRLGEVIVFSEGDDRPIMVKVKKHERGDGAHSAQEQNQRVVASTAATVDHLRSTDGPDVEAVRLRPDWDRARGPAETPEFQQILSSMVLRLALGGTTVEEGLEDAVSFARARQPGLAQSNDFLLSLIIQGLDLKLRALGRAYEWEFGEISELRDRLLSSVLKTLKSLSDGGPESLLDRDESYRVEPVEFMTAYLDLCVRGFDPFPSCSLICDQEPPLCLYRYHVADIARGWDLYREFTAAIRQSNEPDELVTRLTDSLVRAIRPQRLREEDGSRAALCMATQVMTAMDELRPGLREKILGDLITAFQV